MYYVRTKPIDVRYHFIDETISQGTITVIKVATIDILKYIYIYMMIKSDVWTWLVFTVCDSP